MRLKSYTITVVLFFLLSHLSPVLATQEKSGQIGLNIGMNKSFYLADVKQTAYLRIGLTGFSQENAADRSPVNIVIDKSGSMSGTKIEKAKEAAIMAIERLSSQDIISLIVYDSTVNVLIPATKVVDMTYIKNKIRQITPGGYTALFAGVSKGATELRKFIAAERVNRIILLSDGLANVGPQTPQALGDLGNSLSKEGISVTTIGLGTGYNEDLMTKLASKSDGNHYFAEQARDLAGVFNNEFGSALAVVAQNIKAEITCMLGIKPLRLLGREGEINGQHVVVSINQLYGDHEKFIVLEVEIGPTTVNKYRKVATVNVYYNNMRSRLNEAVSGDVDVSFTHSKKLIEKNTDH
ncbi:VWA domain-containing protein [candidate division CSSED10-310 bacterium]|uniref:VWA domain-containing protein n=1 Tax=candidate division CSSED10-310 bacterium TaxID=2855610 RepID=A0ABV6Z4Y4_UNCC1